MLTPNWTYTVNGVTVHEKIIPDGTVWRSEAKAQAAGGYHAGDLYKKQKKLSSGTGKVRRVTVHNTNDLPRVEDDGEQYTRATYNENMGTSRVHFYIDDLCAWQNLKAGTGQCPNDPKGSAEIGWHAGDGSTTGGGNESSLGIEIIMNDTAEHDAKAYDNGARLCAWLLYEHGLTINELVTHSYWNAKKAGKTDPDIDRMCVTFVQDKHWCPYYIFNAKNENEAYANWKKFKSTVKGYLDALNETVLPPIATQTDKLYRIQAGAFRNKSYADDYLKTVQKVFPDAYRRKDDEYFRIQIGAFRVEANADAYLKIVQQSFPNAFKKAYAV